MSLYTLVPLASSSNPLDELSAREFLTIIEEELNNLSEKHRLALILCHLEGLTMEQAGKRLGLCAGALRGRLERARLRLRQRLAKRGLAVGTTPAGSLLWVQTVVAVPPALTPARFAPMIPCPTAPLLPALVSHLADSDAA